MNQIPITITIGENSYILRPDAPEDINNIPASDRQQLIAVLESIKQKEVTHTDSLVSKPSPTEISITTSEEDHAVTSADFGGERITNADADDIMASLIAHERTNHEAMKKNILKWAIAIAVIFVVLMLIL